MKNLNKGFTLAEIVIVLAIVGFLAAILIPALTNMRPNQEMVMLKKVYYLAGRTINELINDDEFYPSEQQGFSNVNRATYHGNTYGTGGTDGANGKFCNLFASRMNLRGTQNCESAKTLNEGGNFVTADGVIWSLPITNFSGDENARFAISVDVNGEKRPNCTEDEYRASASACGGMGPDRFTINIDRFGVMYVPQGIEQDYLSSNDTTKRYNDFRNH